MHDQKYDRINTLASKERDRCSVADRVSAFISAGGHVHSIAPGVSGEKTRPYGNRRTTNSRGQFA
ncbi:hypothetical protein ACF8C6_08885 [Pseudomonas sp. zbq_18]|uniref:hypothetical protein n=1 Tax=Pseudomonas sp. zbq_18 TaxID=3367251 RepID=UPI00370CEE9E